VQNPERYVLKPQREGGGNNLYGQDLVQRLQQGLAADGGRGLAAFILMQRIVPPPQRGVFVRAGAWQEDESLSELGIYGTFLKVGQQVVANEEVGHLVRTKTSSSNEGGVAAGFAVLDSPLLATPGTGLLHPLLEHAERGGSGSSSTSGSQASWGADGGVLAVAKALLQ
jgi:glutathione synthase